MTILNMVTKGSGGGANIGEPLNLTVTTSGIDATITWTDNEIGTIPPTSFAKSELVRKVGSAPTSPSDGTLVVTETVKDTYKTTGYVDSGLTNRTTYYYRVFSYSDLGGISYCDAVSVTIRALPVEYQEVEWIQASGSCCVEIGGYTLSGYQRIETKFNTAALNSSGQVPFFWGNVPSGQNYLTCKLPDLDQFQAGIGNDDLYIGSLATNTDYTMTQIANNGNLTMDINGATYTDTYTGSPIATHFPLFCRWRDASEQYSYHATDMKLYYFKVYNTSADCVRDLVPCYRIADTVIGLYDLIDDRFYTNSGSGTFTKGPDVN